MNDRMIFHVVGHIFSRQCHFTANMVELAPHYDTRTAALELRVRVQMLVPLTKFTYPLAAAKAMGAVDTDLVQHSL